MIRYSNKHVTWMTPVVGIAVAVGAMIAAPSDVTAQNSAAKKTHRLVKRRPLRRSPPPLRLGRGHGR